MILFINGSLNSGKSTIAKLLSERLEQTAVIEVDLLRSFIQWMPLVPSIPINLEGACLLAENFVSHGLHVIIPYPLSEENYTYMQKKLSSLPTKLYVCTLNPALDVITKNRGDRELSTWELQRIYYHYEHGLNSPSFGFIIDNTFQTPQETTEAVYKYIHT
jgi:hypothetical protein